jgi:prepilin-type N-terminal cleavage/methylation domain-containing protein
MNIADLITGRAWPALRSARGFTLVELLIVLVVLAILTAVAVPSYLGVRNRAADAAARADIRAAVPAATAYAAENVGVKGDADNKAATRGFKGMSLKLLRNYDAGLSDAVKIVSGKTTESQFCLAATVSGRSWSVLGPGTAFKPNAKCK